MTHNDSAVKQPSQQVRDLVTEHLAVATGHSATFRRTWEDELGDTPEARLAAAVWRAWDIEGPAVLLRAEWFGGQIARFYDWMDPPDPCMRELFGLTYLDVARSEWWELKWQKHVELLQGLLTSGLSPMEAACVLRVAQNKSQGRRINTKALVRTARKFKKFDFSIHFENIWILQNATTSQVKKLHGSVFFCGDSQLARFENQLARYWGRRRTIREKLKNY
jgi:hypothetical protein